MDGIDLGGMLKDIIDEFGARLVALEQMFVGERLDALEQQIEMLQEEERCTRTM